MVLTLAHKNFYMEAMNLYRKLGKGDVAFIA